MFSWNRFARRVCLLLAMLLCPAWANAAPTVLQVDGRERIAVWPAVTLLADPSHRLGIADVLARRAEFAPHTGTPGNLGRHAAALWLHVPLDVAGSGPQQRVLEIDYPSLNRVEVYVVRDGQVSAPQVLGNDLVFSARPLPSRAHSAPLTLQAGRSELLIRVNTHSSMVLPITLRTTDGFLAVESATHLGQGVLLGGDEFVVLAGELIDDEAALRLGEKLLAAFDEPFNILGQRCNVGLTIGYAMAPADGNHSFDLLKSADAAMYAGKRAGRHCMHRAVQASA